VGFSLEEYSLGEYFPDEYSLQILWDLALKSTSLSSTPPDEYFSDEYSL